VCAYYYHTLVSLSSVLLLIGGILIIFEFTMPRLQHQLAHYGRRYAPYAAVGSLAHNPTVQRNIVRAGRAVGRRVANWWGSQKPEPRPLQRAKKDAVMPTNNGRGVTKYFDVANIYSRRRGSKRSRRLHSRRSRFKKRVRACITKELGSRTVLLNNVTTWTQAAPTTAQLLLDFSLFGVDNNTSARNSDLYNIVTSENLNSGAQKTGKLLFLGGVLDVTIQNSSTNTAGGTNTVGNVELDIYEMYFRKPLLDAQAGGDEANLKAVFDAVQGNIPAVGGAPLAGALTIESIGCTPFDIPEVAKEYGMKILSKKKYMLGPGDTCTYQLRLRKRKTLDKQNVLNLTGLGANMPGWTRWVFGIAKLTPLDRYQSGASCIITTGVTRKYIYKKIQNEGDFGSVATE